MPGIWMRIWELLRGARLDGELDEEVSLHLESDGFGSGIVIIGGKAAVTAEGVDPRDDNEFWAKYHMEAEALGLGDAIASYSVRITITPTTLRTTFPT